jgi:hypothetical protein
MADYLLAKHYLFCFTFFPESERPLRAVIRNLPIDTSAEGISNGLVEQGFGMTAEIVIGRPVTRVANRPGIEPPVQDPGWVIPGTQNDPEFERKPPANLFFHSSASSRLPLSHTTFPSPILHHPFSVSFTSCSVGMGKTITFLKQFQQFKFQKYNSYK